MCFSVNIEKNNGEVGKVTCQRASDSGSKCKSESVQMKPKVSNIQTNERKNNNVLFVVAT